MSINKTTYEVKTDNEITISSTLNKLRIIGRDDLTEAELNAEYLRIIQNKVQSMLDDNISVVKVTSYKEIVDKYAFTLEELISLGHHIIDTDDGMMIDVK